MSGMDMVGYQVTLDLNQINGVLDSAVMVLNDKLQDQLRTLNDEIRSASIAQHKAMPIRNGKTWSAPPNSWVKRFMPNSMWLRQSSEMKCYSSRHPLEGCETARYKVWSET